MNYWLMKSEPAVFSIHDLQRKGREPWDGVRNYQARNFMRDAMQSGDLVLFYHSNAEPPGVAGIARIAGPARPDPTAFDPHSNHFDHSSSPAQPRWWLVDVEYVEAFPHLVSLAELRAQEELQDMQLLRPGNRLSVMPVRPEEFAHIIRIGRSPTARNPHD